MGPSVEKVILQKVLSSGNTNPRFAGSSGGAMVFKKVDLLFAGSWQPSLPISIPRTRQPSFKVSLIRSSSVSPELEVASYSN